MAGGEPVYITKANLEGLRELTGPDGGSVLDAYQALRAALSSRGGAALAALYAEPIVTHGNGATATSIAWYAAVSGEPVPLADLDPEARRGPEARLVELLARAGALLADPDLGPLVGAALHIAGFGDIWVVDGQPVLVNWGLLPEAATQSREARDEHFQRTLGRFLVLGRAPAISEAEWRERYPEGATTPIAAVPPPAAAGPGAIGASGPAAPAETVPGGPISGRTVSEESATAGTGARAAADGIVAGPALPGAAVTGASGPSVLVEHRRRGWVPVLIAVLVLAAILFYLLLPGVLLYPEQPVLAATTPGGDLATREAVIRSLERRAESLREALQQNQCIAEGDPLLPDPNRPGVTLLPPSPHQTLVPPPGGAGATPSESLPDLLRKATVLVLAGGADGDGVSIGTGFVVAPGYIVTNHHVVEAADPSAIYVTNQALGGAKPAQIVVQTASSDIGGSDFAVLRVDAAAGLPALVLSTDLDQLVNVVAAGFPGLAMQTDHAFRRMIEQHDPTAIPAVSLTQGVVTVIQNLNGPTPLVIHSAQISPGNSGGPLVDFCGRVVGVNTFFSHDDESRLNYSLKVDALQAFLAGNSIAYEIASGACTPTLAQAAPPEAPDQVGGQGADHGTSDEGQAQESPQGSSQGNPQ